MVAIRRSNAAPPAHPSSATVTLPAEAVATLDSFKLHLLATLLRLHGWNRAFSIGDPRRLLALLPGWTPTRFESSRNALLELGWLVRGAGGWKLVDVSRDTEPEADLAGIGREVLAAVAALPNDDAQALAREVLRVIAAEAAPAPAPPPARPRLSREQRDRETVEAMRRDRRPTVVMKLAHRYASTGTEREIESLARHFRRLRERAGLNRRKLRASQRPARLGVSAFSDSGIPPSRPSP